MHDSLNNEIKRKAFHSLALIYILGYLYLERNLFLKTMAALLTLTTLIEFGRFLFPKINMKVVGWFDNIRRSEELYRPSGIFWTLLGSILTMGTFTDKKVVLCSMGYLIFGDTVSALIGVKYGRHKFLNKSLEGSAAFFGAGIMIGLFFFNPWIAIAGSLFAAIIELLPLPFNDNLWIPTLSASFLTLILYGF